MGIQREECIVSACMLKEATPVGDKRSKWEPLCPEAFWRAYFRQEIR